MTQPAPPSDHRPTGGIAVLATCFNRKETTLRGLTALRTAAGDLSYHVWLVDDGSRDGTGEAVRKAFPEVTVIEGDGSLYWNGGMLRAWQAALDQRPDYYLLFNDDLELRNGSLAKMYAYQKAMESQHGPKVITIGKVVDRATGEPTYGGYVRVPGLSRLRFALTPDDGRSCETMNGNCVLIPAGAVADVGLLDPRYRHHFGDVDYGLRAHDQGYLLFQTPDAVGYTSFNDAAYNRSTRLTPRSWRAVISDPKGLPPREWLHFCRRHGGRRWPLNFVIRYLK